MASLREIRAKIKSVKGTQKITSAMKLVAASKLRRAQDAILAARPYALELRGLIQRVAARVPTEEGEAPHPLLQTFEKKRRVLVAVLSSDRGLCGGFNNNGLRAAEQFINDNRKHYESLEVATIGRRAAEHFKRYESVRNFPEIYKDLRFRSAQHIAEQLAEEYTDKDLDAVFLIYSEFKSAIAQEIVVRQVLPVDIPTSASTLQAESADENYIYEETEQSVLSKLLPRYVALEVWRALLESQASEHGARMTAMDNATKNAKELVGQLTLQYNRARQAAITQELMEIIGGAEALNG